MRAAGRGLVVLAVAVAAAGAAPACGDNGDRGADGLVIAPVSIELQLGETAAVSAIYVDGGDDAPADGATWTTSDPAIATVDGHGATASITARGPGAVAITADGRGASGSIAVEVLEPALVTLAITPPSPAVAAGTTLELAAVGTYSDHATADVTAAVTWISTLPSVATVAAGTATGVQPGTTTIVAQLDGVTGVAALAVTDPPLVALELSPGDTTAPQGQSVQFFALGGFADGSSRDVSGDVTWTSSDESIAAMFGDGFVLTQAMGVATISATFEAMTAVAELEVLAPALVGLWCAPDSVVVAPGDTVQLVAMGSFSDGSSHEITDVDWTSGDEAVATVDASGLVTAHAPGSSLLTAHAETLFGKAVGICFVDVVAPDPGGVAAPARE